jgi:hypothetical protein
MLYIVTDPVEPLSVKLRSVEAEGRSNFIAWGLLRILVSIRGTGNEATHRAVSFADESAAHGWLSASVMLTHSLSLAHEIQTALKFLHVDAGLSHCNLKVDSIYTLKSGEWRLGGFEVLSSLKDETPFVCVSRGSPKQLECDLQKMQAGDRLLMFRKFS